MKYTESHPKIASSYNLCFVVILISVFLYVMIMSVNSHGFGKLEENFFQKSLLIEYFNRLRIKIGDRVFPKTLIGKNGWMEYTDENNLDDYQNAVNFSPDELQATALAMQNCYQFAREHNITFLVVVAPNKASVYPDMLPEQIKPLSNLSRLDQLNKYLREHNIPEVLDLRFALRNARQQQDVYYKTGTHWNDYGAYIAYQEILESLSPVYPDLKPYSAKFLQFRNISPNKTYQIDNGIANLLQANYLIPESTLFSTRNLDGIVQKVDFANARSDFHEISWIPNSTLPTLLIFHDSFGNWGLNNFLALNFSKAYYIHLNSFSLFLNKQAIEQFSPNIMIYEIVERHIQNSRYLLPGCAP